MPTTRFEAFSDGVYAIVITLLVLDLDVPGSPDRLTENLAGAWPSFLAYLVSFVFVGGSWLAHFRMSRHLSATDDTLNGLNLLLLLFVTFIPFTTSLMASHLTDSGQRLAVGLFGANLTLATAMSTVLPVYAALNENLADQDARSRLRHFGNTRWSFVLLLGLSTVVGAFLPTVAVAFYLAVSGMMLVRPFRRLDRRGQIIHRISRRADRGASQREQDL